MNIAVIGAGASSLFLSLLLARKNHKVTVFEKNSKVGRKLLITGNGRCNITNENISVKNFHSMNIDFVKYAINQFDYFKCKNFFNDLGIEFHIGKNTRAYPMSLTASTVVDILYDEALQKGVEFHLDNFIENIRFENGAFLLNGKDKFDKVVVATGSPAMPKLGSNTSGYKIAEEFGHSIIEPFASLVQLQSSNKNLDIITGVKIEGLIGKHEGDILFTKYGISGSAVLDISRELSYSLQYEKSQAVTIDTMPSFSKDKLTDMLLSRIKKHPKRSILLWLDGLINKKLAKYILLEISILNEKSKVSELNRKDVQKVVHMIKNMRFEITGTKGFDTCEVCAGGVDTTQVDPKTMESKLQKGLYFTGEVLDVDGDCGGYNLHWAWASSFVASKSI
jgi:hypothetical protein